ncbi:MAG: phenylalanine--tRNA ligase subunit alpha [Bacteroidetes bacterium]|nr:phenylalanine--tRNA ligase subunit alpha [Bacteroidota bacterium]
MQDQIAALEQEIMATTLADAAALEVYRRQYTGKNGIIAALFETFRALPGPEKAAIGKPLNTLKQLAEQKEREARESLAARQPLKDQPADLTLPAAPHAQGSRHPIYDVERRIIAIFERIGFTVADGPEVETDWHNFTALNFDPGHPARDMQDTFFLKPEGMDQEYLLRTHTSSVQVRVMEAQKPPIRILSPGRVYRNETVSARAHCYFNQVEGLCVDKHISLADLRQTLDYFVKSIFGPQVRTRLRASYFPFTEISAEMDISCLICQGEGCTVCKHSGWVEIMGCGMVDPNVLANCGIDPEVYSGFAFGMGVERIAQLLYRVPDLRLYSQNDIRFLQQFARIQ